MICRRAQSMIFPYTTLFRSLRMRIRDLAQARVRYGYRRLRVLLNREGWRVGKYLVYRLYKEEGLVLKKRDRKSTRLNSSHPSISYAVFCLKKIIRRREEAVN